MSLKKITTEITYKVPAWEYCNHQATILGQPSKDKCRFCVKEKDHYRCALYNEILTSEGALISKSRCCQKAMAGFKSKVVDADDMAPSVDPRLIVKTTISEYNKIRKQLISQGYPETIAEKVAKETLLGGN